MLMKTRENFHEKRETSSPDILFVPYKLQKAGLFALNSAKDWISRYIRMYPTNIYD